MSDAATESAPATALEEASAAAVAAAVLGVELGGRGVMGRPARKMPEPARTRLVDAIERASRAARKLAKASVQERRQWCIEQAALAKLDPTNDVATQLVGLRLFEAIQHNEFDKAADAFPPAAGATINNFGVPGADAAAIAAAREAAQSTAGDGDAAAGRDED
jgi:hypothetical protein